MPTIQIHMFEGRSLDQKRTLVKKITDVVCETVDVTPEKVKIIISEMKFEHYAEAGILRADK